MIIKAAVLREQGMDPPYSASRPLQIEEVELDGPREGELLVRIVAAGLCHSDLSMIDGSRVRRLPSVPGHEAAGVVEEVGPRVQDVQVGDHVVMVFVGSCGECRFCIEGKANLCRQSWEDRAAGTLRGGARRLSQNGSVLHHASGISAFAEAAVVASSSAVVIDPGVPLDHAALFGCAVITGVGAVTNTARVRAGTKVAVVGLGGVGLSAVMGAVLTGAAEIIAVDTQAAKLSLAKELGATRVYGATADDFMGSHRKHRDVASAILDDTHGGVDYVFETAGTESSLRTASELAVRGGSLTLVGLPRPGVNLPLDAARIVADGLVIRGSYMGGCLPRRDIPRLLDLYSNGRLPVERLLSGRRALEEINEALDTLAAGSTVRELIAPQL